jgi:ubiquinone/menaquinone biosynthesis C-methylase UbiE
MFDFSPKTISWIKSQFPTKYKFEAWVGDIQDIRYDQNSLDDYFNVVTCIDVTEHLPKDIYFKAIKEIYRVTKPDGLLILMQGNAILPEHINVISEEKLLEDFCSVGFKFLKSLPHRHHLLTK